MTYNPSPSGGSGEQHPGQPPSASTPGGFFSALFDFSFNRFVTPSVVRVLYILGFAVIILSYLFFLANTFDFSPGLGVVVGSWYC